MSANASKDEHDRADHQCCMGGRCFYFPQPGPPGETGDGGVCQDCADEEFTSYFCSQDCYHHNLVGPCNYEGLKRTNVGYRNFIETTFTWARAFIMIQICWRFLDPRVIWSWCLERGFPRRDK